MSSFTRKTLALVVSGTCILGAVPGIAQDDQARGNQNEQRGSEVKTTDEIVVIGHIGYRNRSSEVLPVLEYDRDYFERFEPLSAGDALKRVPSVTFLSDVTESDGARLRGLNPGYTQVLINGERVPGSGNDRSFLLDRIPAELIERVEVIRSNSASRPGDAVAGSLNIILKDSYTLDGGYIRGGALSFDGEEVKESVSGVWGGQLGEGRLIVTANQQSRYNPKIKSSVRYGDSPENNPAYRAEEFDNREDQTDTRDSSDTSFNADYVLNLSDGSELQLGGFWVQTDRTEDERSLEYDHRYLRTGPVMDGGNLETDNQQHQDIDETNYSLSAAFSKPMLGGESKVKLGFSRFDSEVDDRESEIDFTDDVAVIEDERALLDLRDDELKLDLSHKLPLGGNTSLQFGAMMLQKERDNNLLEGDDERDLLLSEEWNHRARSPLHLAGPLNELEAADGSVNTINEDRSDVYALVKGGDAAMSWEAGLRYEMTDVEVNDETVDPAQAKHSTDYSFLLPSAHIRYNLTDNDRLSASVSRTVRRPDFDLISPALLEEEKADNDFIGNPYLEPELAWGLDLGYERRLGNQGVVGFNLFYRDISDLIEIANTGAEGSEGPGTFVLTADNVGDGYLRGLELDLSTPLSAFGLDNTGVFLNYSWLDSEVEDVFGERRFNDQSKWVYNVGFIQDLPSLAASFGITYREQGDAFGRIIGEEVTTSYGADLEFFAEKRWRSLTLRFVGSNLLDSSKDEIFNKFDSVADQMNRDFDEYELETEEAGPIFQLMARYAF